MTTLPTNNSRAGLLKLVRGAAVAALYALFTLAIAPISSGLMQLRLSEGLCVLPYFAPEMAIGLFVGCVLITAYMGKRGMSKWLAPLPAVVMNALVVGAVLCYGYQVGVSYPVCALYVGAGEAISCYAVGMPLLAALNPIKKRLFD